MEHPVPGKTAQLVKHRDHVGLLKRVVSAAQCNTQQSGQATFEKRSKVDFVVSSLITPQHPNDRENRQHTGCHSQTIQGRIVFFRYRQEIRSSNVEK
jgi:hypothetical protein